MVRGCLKVYCDEEILHSLLLIETAAERPSMAVFHIAVLKLLIIIVPNGR
jgi:hypothetical protein